MPSQLSHASRQADKQAIKVKRASLEAGKRKGEGRKKFRKKKDRYRPSNLRDRLQNAIRQLHCIQNANRLTKRKCCQATACT
jgi:hypothetical protein